MKLRPFVAGAATYVPGLYPRLRGGTGGTISAEYCYGVWLKHLALSSGAGLQQVPRTVAELGPGDSLGMGLCALLSGADTYYAFDVVRYATNDRNAHIFEELVAFFRARQDTPDRDGWPNVRPFMGGGLFPVTLLTADQLEASLQPARLQAIRDCLAHVDDPAFPGSGGVRIQYVAPWETNVDLPPASVDFLFSHSVLEHIVDLPSAYSAMHRWLSPDGCMSHQADFSCHGTAERWNGHWGYPDWAWAIVRGNRPFLLNRQPLSLHQRLLERAGFVSLRVLRHENLGGLTRNQLAARWRGLPESDVVCDSAYLLAVRSDSPLAHQVEPAPCEIDRA